MWNVFIFIFWCYFGWFAWLLFYVVFFLFMVYVYKYFGYLSIDSRGMGNCAMILWRFFFYLFIYVAFGFFELWNNNITVTRYILYVIKSLTLTFMQPSKCWSNRESSILMFYFFSILVKTLSQCSGTKEFSFI